MDSFPIASCSRGMIKIKLFWVNINSDIGLYIKEINHDNVIKGAPAAIHYGDVTEASMDHAHMETVKEDR